ncbi:Arc-like DNA binding domain protein [compost metagenome]
MTKLQRVEKDKFVVRFPKEGVRDQIAIAADDLHLSMNGWILQAIDEKLARGARLDRLLDAAERGVTINNFTTIGQGADQ